MRAHDPRRQLLRGDDPTWEHHPKAQRRRDDRLSGALSGAGSTAADARLAAPDPDRGRAGRRDGDCRDVQQMAVSEPVAQASTLTGMDPPVLTFSDPPSAQTRVTAQ